MKILREKFTIVHYLDHSWFWRVGLCFLVFFYSLLLPSWSVCLFFKRILTAASMPRLCCIVCLVLFYNKQIFRSCHISLEVISFSLFQKRSQAEAVSSICCNFFHCAFKFLGNTADWSKPLPRNDRLERYFLISNQIHIYYDCFFPLIFLT